MKKKGRETFIFRVASPGLRRRAGKSLYLCNCVRQLYLLLFSFFFCPVPSACCPFPINWMLYMLNTRRRSRRTDKESPCRHISLLPSFSTNRRTTRIIIHPNAILVGKKSRDLTWSQPGRFSRFGFFFIFFLNLNIILLCESVSFWWRLYPWQLARSTTGPTRIHAPDEILSVFPFKAQVSLRAFTVWSAPKTKVMDHASRDSFHENGDNNLSKIKVN